MTVTSPHDVQRLAPLGGPLAGRSQEMEALRRAWDNALRDHGGMVLLAGEAGMGKSRLAAELAGEVDAAGGSVLVGGCPAGGAEPYHPLVEAFGPLPPAQGSDRDGVFQELAQVVAARAARTPVLIVLDDLHRTDRSTVLAVGAVVEAAGGTRLLFVGTYRDTSVDRSHALIELLSAPGVERIEVDSLSADDVAEMVGDVELGRQVWRRSAGNPVAVAELLRQHALDGPATTSFDELVARRVSTLRPPARKILGAAAVAGSDFHIDVVARAVGIPVSRAPAVLKEIAAAGFVVEEPAGPGASRRFVHDMVRESVEGSLDMLDRLELHRLLARALEDDASRVGAPAALLAWHYRAAAPVGGSVRALGHSARAGVLAMTQLAWEEAAVHHGHALAAATAHGRRSAPTCCWRWARPSGWPVRRREPARRSSRRRRWPSAAGTAPAWRERRPGAGRCGVGEHHELEVLAGEARSLLGPDSPRLAVVRFTDFASDALYDVPIGPAPAAAASAGSSTAVALLRARHQALSGPEHAAERMAAAEEMVELATRRGDVELEAIGRGWRAVGALELAKVEKSSADQAAHETAARRTGRPDHASGVEAWAAMRALLEGRVDDAKAAAAAALARAREAGDPQAEEWYLAQRWWLALEWGTTVELAAVVGECRARASSGGSPTWRAAASLALARNGELDLAAEELRRVTDHGMGDLLRDSGRLHPLACLAEVTWMLADGPRAAVVAPLIEPFAGRLVVVGRGRACMGSMARACGLIGRRHPSLGRCRPPPAVCAVHQRKHRCPAAGGPHPLRVVDDPPRPWPQGRPPAGGRVAAEVRRARCPPGDDPPPGGAGRAV